MIRYSRDVDEKYGIVTYTEEEWEPIEIDGEKCLRFITYTGRKWKMQPEGWEQQALQAGWIPPDVVTYSKEVPSAAVLMNTKPTKPLEQTHVSESR